MHRLLLAPPVLAAVTLLGACGAAAPPTSAAGGVAPPGAGTSTGSREPARSGPPLPVRTGPVPGDGRASCVEGYDSTTIGHRSFAFDGTVTALGPGTTNRPGTGRLDTVAVTFAVNEWFTGGTGATVTVDLMSPASTGSGNEVPLYEQGTRLLVSGEPRWGGDPLQDPIAWSCGGFTRYYEPAVADDWRRGTA